MINNEMTEIELELKKIYKQRKDIQDKIISSEELSSYISWMISSYNNKVVVKEDNIINPKNAISELINRVVSNPNDKQAIINLNATYRYQNEANYLKNNYDISVGRMLRYMPAHWHTDDYFEMYYCFSGNTHIHFENTVTELKQGDVMIISPNIRHASPCYSDEAILYYYMIRSSTFEKVFWNQLPENSLMASFFRKSLSDKIDASYIQFETNADEEIKDILININNEYTKDSLYSSQMINSLISIFFITLLRKYENTAKLPRTNDFYWKKEFSQIFSYIQEHYNDMTLGEIAKHLGYSERQITRIIINCTGNNYSNLVLKLRMETAANMLAHSNIDIKKISELCGYNNVSSFYRAFIKYYNETPAQYMKMMRN